MMDQSDRQSSKYKSCDEETKRHIENFIKMVSFLVCFSR